MLACVGLYKQEIPSSFANPTAAPKLKVSSYAISPIFEIVAGFSV
jgi:hypothetical protein